MRIALRCCAISLISVGLVSCVPMELQQKYQSNSYLENDATNPNGDKPAVAEGQVNPAPTSPPVKADSKVSTTVYMVDKSTFRFLLKPSTVWDSAVNVLMRNYNLNIVDKSSGIITTEWDSYYQDSRLYRNKVTVLLKNTSWNHSDVVVFNNTEVLKDGQTGGFDAIWLPAKGDDREMGRIVQNMALYLNQPIPTLPEGMTATSPKEKNHQAE